ncbi:MAG: pilus assembly PilX N-terminal domain-containing protein [Thermodesulfobacteriota bacterium]|nr:pilus assembly PilX N-terminal domain-containing protein [Thermodesulfobacteriota bacterium]
MPAIRMIYNNEKGFVLPVGLMFLAIIAILGTTAVIITTTDLKIGSNYRTSEQAFYAAEAGIEEARARLRGSSTAYAGDSASPLNPFWSVYLSSGSWTPSSDDPDFNSSYANTSVSSLQTDISYLVKIRHKREYDAEQAGHTTSLPHYYDGDGNTGTNPVSAPGSIIYYGYGDPSQPTTMVQFTTSGATEHKPVEIITAYGQSSNSLKIIEVEVEQNPGPPINSAMYAKDDITINGVAANVNGNDNCGIAPAKPPVYTLFPFNTIPATDPSIYSGNPAYPINGSDDINIAGYVNSLKASATEIITADQIGGALVTYGDAGNFVTCYCDATSLDPLPGLDMQKVIGHGILLVEGDLTMSGGFNWNGIILVTGTLTFNGGGPNSINIQGAVLANNTVDINGGVTIAYDSCMIDNSLNNLSLEIISWKETY